MSLTNDLVSQFVKATKDAVIVVEKGSAGEGVVVPSEE